MKSIVIAGRLTKNAETRTSQGGDQVTGFSVAVDDGYGDTKRTIFFDCSWWGKRGSAVAQYLTKGSSVTVSGDLSTREYDGKTYLTVRVNDLTLQGGKPSEGGSQPRSGAPAGGYGGGLPDMDDEIPFAPQVL